MELEPALKKSKKQQQQQNSGDYIPEDASAGILVHLLRKSLQRFKPLRGRMAGCNVLTSATRTMAFEADGIDEITMEDLRTPFLRLELLSFLDAPGAKKECYCIQ